MTEVTAPMTGIVYQLPVAAGATVAEGDGVVVLESMKMHVPVTAPKAGQVQEIRVKEGDFVAGRRRLVCPRMSSCWRTSRGRTCGGCGSIGPTSATRCSRAMLEQLVTALESRGARRRRAGGGADRHGFGLCAGADINEFRDSLRGRVPAVYEDGRWFVRLFQLGDAYEKPSSPRSTAPRWAAASVWWRCVISLWPRTRRCSAPRNCASACFRW